ncbi:PID-CTERM protein-sorting domain-containing protein [Lutibacter sp.]|uniref:PID-CTERM protein-sorting domain-containing protein n=1 Tax=Lutibacter sp. TaxID=1925666 RepID=UPI0035646CD8
MKKKRINIFLLSFCFMLISVVAYSKKPPYPPKNAAAGPPPPPPGLPIDGGLSLLLVSGVAYGIYELKRKK